MEERYITFTKLTQYDTLDPVSGYNIPVMIPHDYSPSPSCLDHDSSEVRLIERWVDFAG